MLTFRYILFLLILVTIPFEALFIPELPLNVPITSVFVFALFLYILGANKALFTVGVEFYLALFVGLALFSSLNALIFNADQLFHVLPDSYGFRASPYRGFYQLIIFIFVYLTALVSRNMTLRRYDLINALKVWFWITIAINVFSYYEVLAKMFGWPLIYPSFTDWDYRSAASVFEIPRAYGTFKEPGDFACFLVTNLVIAWNLLQSRENQHLFAPLPLKRVMVTSLVCLCLTFSATGFAVLVMILSLIAIWPRFGGPSRSRSTIAPIVLVALMVFFLLDSGIWSYLYEGRYQKMISAFDSDSSDLSRAQGLILGLKAFKEHPILGVGFGNEPFYTYQPNVSALEMGSFNLAVSRLLEVGIIGTLSYVLLLRKMFRPVILSSMGLILRPDLRVLTDAFRWGLAASLVFNVFSGAHYISFLQWLLVGLIASTMNMQPHQSA